MKFSEKIRTLRKENKLTQSQLADKIGVTTRMIQNYEYDHSYPKNRQQYEKLAESLGCPLTYLFTEDADFISEAQSRYGLRGRQQAEDLVGELGALFAGGELTEDDKDAVMRSLQEAYWEAKKANKEKYSSKKADKK